MIQNYTPGRMGPRFVLPEARGLKRLYLRLFGIPDVRAHLTAAHALQELAQLPFASVLDVGCGGGAVTCCIAAHHPQCTVVGVDQDEEGIKYASALARQNGLDRLSFRAANLERDSLSGKFDLVTCFAVLQFIRDCPWALRNLNGALVPGGHLLLQLPSTNRVEYLMKSPRLHRRYPDFHEARGPFTPAEARRLVTDNGFTVVRINEAIKGPSVLAKELFYLTLSFSRAVNQASCPLLNWVPAWDGRYRGHGNALFVLARKVREV